MKTPLVLLHGWGLNSQIWNGILPELDNSFDLHILDLPGYGNDVQYAGPFTMQSVVDRVLCSAPPKSHWVAWSLGATIAIQAALKNPERFLKLQLVSPTPRFMAGSDWEFGMQAEPLNRLMRQFGVSYEKGLKKFLFLQSANQAEARESNRQLLGAILSLPKPGTETLQQTLNLLTQIDLREQITKLTVDTQIIAGRHDRVVSPQASRWLSEMLPDAELIMLEAGHLPFLDAKADFLKNLQSLAGVPIG